MAAKDRRTVSDLTDLVSAVGRSAGFAEVLAALGRGEEATIDGAWGSSRALCAAAVASSDSSPLLVVLPRVSEMEDVVGDLSCFLGQRPVVFPAWETLPRERAVGDEQFGARLQVLRALESRRPPQVIVTALPALLQPVPDRSARDRGACHLRVGEEIDTERLMRRLVEAGFVRASAIEVPGEFSMHGGILDLFPPGEPDPLRLELFGDEIESIRRFDVGTQRKIIDLDEAALTLISPVDVDSARESRAGDGTEPSGDEGGESLFDSLPTGSRVAIAELSEMIAEGGQYLERLDDRRGLFSVQATLARCAEFPLVEIATLTADSRPSACHLRIESIERLAGPRGKALEELAAMVEGDERVLIACHNQGEQDRLSEMLREAKLPIISGVRLCLGSLSRGFRLVPERLLVLSDHELFGRVDLRRTARRRRPDARTIDSFLELREGDLVVHLTHGIGRYRGMKLLDKGDQTEEHLVLEFRGGVRVYVPVSLIHLVQKYVGAAGSAPRLSVLGGSGWSKKKQKVAAAVSDLASEMIRLQAAREAKPGWAFPPDSHWQHEFEAAFPWVETDDQLDTIADVKADMQRSRPMDRLICGDVGYGKTEVAMRAAFKTVEGGKQVAVLVPTTVLAEQHYRTFCERTAEFPITIEVLSRFKSKAQQRKILEKLADGAVDIVIGTHRLVQKDVRLKDLGLLVIDEEQRFGVAAKEMLKRLRLEVDVLTMTATPIPRTLHMAILGVRDISNLLTAPQDRQAVETRICRFDEELIRRTIIRELNRNGQVYFVHNRVHDIRTIAERIQSIVPEARLGIGHGQMPEGQLEAAMLEFVSGKTDVLVCTTIIESGLDIPNANTMFIHQAENFGLADLHQLRGRVGRYKHRAYCYLMLDEKRTVTPTAAKRLKAIEEFSELGAGFKIAMRDLEIRGAGNILGTEQSGHIATVGYELYCHLVENAVRVLKKQPLREHRHVAIDLPTAAYLPDDYLPAGRQKIEIYRRLSLVANRRELDDLVGELRDRFGKIPPEAMRLVAITELQLFARGWQIDDIHLEDRFAVFGYRDPARIRVLAERCGSRLRIVDARSAYLVLDEAEHRGELVAWLKSVLRPEAE